ncbi:MAG: hypothetical protein AAF611_20575 [Bacteroidota bacterium]
MSTVIKYKNSQDQYITEQQAQQLSFYHKLFIESSELKKVETYREGELKGGIYYLSTSENATTVLTSLGAALNWSMASNKQVTGGYTVWEYRTYDQSLQVNPEYYKVVTDSNEKMIASVTYDTATGNSKSAFKTFYFGGQPVSDDDSDVFFEEDAQVSFLFDDTGVVERIDMNVEYVNNQATWYDASSFLSQASEFISELMTTDQVTYFTNVLPLVPNF